MTNTLIEVDLEEPIDQDDACLVFGTALFHLLGNNEGIVVNYNDEKVIVHKSTDNENHERINIDYFEDAISLDEGQLVILQYDNDDQIEEEDSVATIIPIDMTGNFTLH